MIRKILLLTMFALVVLRGLVLSRRNEEPQVNLLYRR